MDNSQIYQKANVIIPELAIPDQPEKTVMSAKEQASLVHHIKLMLQEKNAVMMAHYYTEGILQDLAEETGGCVADSLEMARFGAEHPADTLIVCGVRFMGETSKILSNDKKVLMPDLEATCSLDENCPSDIFSNYCDQYPEHTVVVYANTSAEVKARSDWVVTSGIALDVVRHLSSRGEKILWGPDRHLGQWVQRMTGVEMIFWPGSCIVHEEFKASLLKTMRRNHPEAAVLVHPESPRSVVEQADVVGSTTALIKATVTMDNHEFIVATDIGIFNKMKQLAPDKTLIEAPTAGEGATCQTCAQCPWMRMNSLEKLAAVLETGDNEIFVEPELAEKAKVPIQRMLDFANTIKK